MDEELLELVLDAIKSLDGLLHASVLHPLQLHPQQVGEDGESAAFHLQVDPVDLVVCDAGEDVLFGGFASLVEFGYDGDLLETVFDCELLHLGDELLEYILLA